MNPDLIPYLIPYDKQRIARQFSKAAITYNQHNQLQRDCADWLLTQLPAQVGSLADLGCGPAAMSQALLARSQQYIGVDLAPGMVAEARRQFPLQLWVCGDVEELPLATSSVDCVVANLMVQWCRCLPRTLNEIVRVLQPGGRALLTTVLAGSMEPLGSLWQQLDGVAHHNEFLTGQQLTEQLAGLEQRNAQLSTRIEVQAMTYEYPGVLAMLQDLKGIGANYTVRSDTARLTRSRLAELENSFTDYLIYSKANERMLPMKWLIALIEIEKKLI